MTTQDLGPTETIGKRIDAAVFRVEKALVTFASLVMTATVTLDIIHRSFESPESQLAQKLMGLGSIVGLPSGPATYAYLRDSVTPIFLLCLAFAGGSTVYLAAQRRRGRRLSPWGVLAWGILVAVSSWLFVQFILLVPSRWVCFSLLTLGCGAWFWTALCERRKLDMAVSGLILVSGFFACGTLPPAYIWSQELSLILLAWVAFLGASMATRAGRHIQVDALSKLLPMRLRPYGRALGLLLTTLFCAYLTALAYAHVFGSTGDFSSGELRPATRLPAWVIIFSAVVSFTLMTCRFAGLTWDAFRTPTLPEKELVH